MAGTKGTGRPADHEARRRIVEELDRTLLVEAGAGTGKTTSMVGRMTALICQGRCLVGNMAAVTFTRKAAAELRSRFQAELEKAEAGEGDGGARAAEALHHLGRCFIGTIHSFCGRLLRERPVEAVVDISFREADEREDALLREEAWFRYVDSLYTSESDVPASLGALGLEIDQLRDSFLDMAGYADVEGWPAPEVALPDFEEAREALSRYVSHIDGLAATFPDDRGSDELMNRYEWVARMARVVDLNVSAELMEVFTLFNARVAVVLKWWPGGTAQGKGEKARWIEFCTDIATPLLTRWHEVRYAVIMPVLLAVREEYDRLRRERGVLSYQDLLLEAARLLRDQETVRRYFGRRFTHLLVDEFQDTDPVQAEVLMLLTATDPTERDWRKCLPRPGSLFVVGDPRQSIYRFRRADIMTYSLVQEIIERSGGETVGLSANFRSGEDLLQWGNGVFDVEFPGEANTWSPAARPMDGGWEEGTSGDLQGVRVLDIPEEMNLAERAVDYEADFIARSIRRALDEGLTVPRSRRELENGLLPQANPGDFMIVSWRRRNLARYAAKLQELGIPHRVSGGSALSQVAELKLLSDCLWTLSEPENPVALLSLLRGDLFGFSDEELYDFRKAGGDFSLHVDVPDGRQGNFFRQAWEKMRQCELWLRRLPPVPAMENIAAYLGLTLRALLEPGADERAGTIAKTFETLRKASREDFPSAAELSDLLRRLIEREEEFDGMPAGVPVEAAVRIMNLHKVKGLEAPVVFLADPTGKVSRIPTMHVNRGGKGTAGYLTVSEEVGGYGRRLLAQPPGWEGLREEEARFAAAELTRLQYVAATRARSMLVVTRKRKWRNTNHWDFFSSHLDGFPLIDDPGAQRAPAGEGYEVTTTEIARREGEIAERYSRIRCPSYALAPPSSRKASAPSALDLHRPGDDGEHGRSWGTVVHFLLELAIRERSADLNDLARHRIMEEGLDSRLAATALEVVASVTGSDLWRRAVASDQVMVEVPVLGGLAGDDGAGPGPAALQRCVIDLLFRDRKGWVIVDYKTEAVPPAEVEERARGYRDQLDGYAGVWERVTGEKVVERGIFFTTPGRYVPL